MVAVDQDQLERDAELDRYRDGIVHVERGLAHVRAALAIVGPVRVGSTARLARIGRELNAGAAQFKSTLIMAGRIPVGASLVDEAAAAAALPVDGATVVSTVTVSTHRSVADRRVIANLSYPEGLAVLEAIETALGLELKRSKRERLERVRVLLEPRVARARRARKATA